MKRLLILIALLTVGASSAAAQQSRTNSKMLYHDGPVLKGFTHVYVIWYGCWTNCSFADPATIPVVENFLSEVGNAPYMQINSSYPDNTGGAPNGVFIFGGGVYDEYSRGVILTQADIAGIISDQINNFQLPQDEKGIYVVITSRDVSANAMGFCITSAPSYHDRVIVNSAVLNYVFLGNPNRCPSASGPQFSQTGPTPNATYAGDVLVNNIAHGLDTTVTNPAGNGWFDRYGLENADKCQNNFGETYTTPNGARANMRIGSRDYLIQQNWVNDRKPHCGMSR